jgi:hypothetical protein
MISTPTPNFPGPKKLRGRGSACVMPSRCPAVAGPAAGCKKDADIGFWRYYIGCQQLQMNIARRVATANQVSFAEILTAPYIDPDGTRAIEIKFVLTPGSSASIMGEPSATYRFPS